MVRTLTRYSPPEGDWDFWPLVGARGDGKTHRAMQAVVDMLGPHESAIVVAPNIDHARWIAQACLVGKIAAEQTVMFNRTQMLVHLTEERRIVFHSAGVLANDLTRLRGQRFKIAVLDEPVLYGRLANAIARDLRMTCSVERVITTSGVY